MLREDLEKVLDEYLDAREENGFISAPIAYHIQQTLKKDIENLINNNRYHVNASAGAGKLSEIPWIGIEKENERDNIATGYYFKSDMSGVYIVLKNFYNNELKNKYGKFLPEHLKTRTRHIKKLLEKSSINITGFNETFNLNAKTKTGKIHENGIILSKFYQKDNIPTDEILINDLKKIIEIQEYVLDNYSDNMYLTVDEWISALENENLIDNKLLNVLEINYNFENHTACFEDIAKERHKLGYPNEKSYNKNIIDSSKKLKKYFNKTEIYGSKNNEIWVPRFFYGAKRKNQKGNLVFYNTLREELAEALEKYDKTKRPDRVMINMNYKDNLENTDTFISFYEYLQDKGYYFDKETIENYLLSLKVKPFVILTGNSGTGKTKLSQLFAQYLNQKDNYKIIPVGANWTENRHILGYFNIIKNEPQYTPAYNLIKHSHEESYPHFLILDEMNLSHVERYFADFLSAIESNENIPLHGKEELEIPSNLFIIGTVNVDETTYMFSPKVLDRANTIEFETYSAKNYMTNKFNASKPKGNIKYLEAILKDQEIQNMSIQELEKIFNNNEFWIELSDEIFKFQEILKKAGFDFGFRVINEIVRFMAVSYKYENEPENWTNWKRYFDAQIKQKMLPKLHGSQKVIGETLDELLKACEDYPTSKAKLEEMIDVLDKQRYVSFIN